MVLLSFCDFEDVGDDVGVTMVMVLVLACDRHVPDKRGRAAAPQCVSGQREGCRGEEGIGEQRYYLYCNHRQLAHNVRTIPKYKPF